jgi:hypothetical protein
MMQAIWAVVRSPHLWPTAVRVARSAAPDSWWRRPPFLPLPSRAYLDFRLITQYGSPRAQPLRDDVVAYLEWCRNWHRALRAGS